MSGYDSSLSLRALVRETVFRPFPLASPSGTLYIERMFLLRLCINQPIHYLRLYRFIYSNKKTGQCVGIVVPVGRIVQLCVEHVKGDALLWGWDRRWWWCECGWWWGGGTPPKQWVCCLASFALCHGGEDGCHGDAEFLWTGVHFPECGWVLFSYRATATQSEIGRAATTKK